MEREEITWNNDKEERRKVKRCLQLLHWYPTRDQGRSACTVRRVCPITDVHRLIIEGWEEKWKDDQYTDEDAQDDEKEEEDDDEEEQEEEEEEEGKEKITYLGRGIACTRHECSSIWS